MQCHRHRETSAVGLCKHCFRAVCPACAETVAGVLACSGSCVQELSIQIEVWELNKKGFQDIKQSRKKPLPALALSIMAAIAWVLAFFLFFGGAEEGQNPLAIIIGLAAFFTFLPSVST